jgi:hypothetical protein
VGQRRTVNLRKLKARALRSRKFRRWHFVDSFVESYHPNRKHVRLHFDEKSVDAIIERHYTPSELGKAWGLSAETIRALFEKERGVLVISTAATGKRRYRTFRIPEHVATRVHTRLSS